MRIKVDDLTGPEISQLLREHLQNLSAISPPCSMHALDIEGLRDPNITFWSVWDEGQLMGCGALKKLEVHHAEIKSMRTAAAHLRKGVASHLLKHIITEARRRNFRRLSLETGSGQKFKPAQALYAKFGFRPCGPFADYVEDVNSFFMTMELQPEVDRLHLQENVDRNP
ncbi:MAG: GNAT family N-acetyltransferase [Limisphaerales bacterium]